MTAKTMTLQEANAIAQRRIEELESQLAERDKRIELLLENVGHVEACNSDLEAKIDGQAERIAELEEENKHLKKIASEAAEYVEDVICMRTHFNGEPPYVGWKGLGLALTERLDELDKDRERLDWIIANKERIHKNGGQYGKYWLSGRDGWYDSARHAIDVAMSHQGDGK